jgi:LEA14-like dessication related protein
LKQDGSDKVNEELSHLKTKAYIKVLFIIAFSMMLASCLSWIVEKPLFVLRKVTIIPRSLTEITLELGIEAQNPNRFDLTLKSFDYTIFLDNEEVGKGRMEKELLIPSSSTSLLQASLVTTFRNFGASLKSIITGSDLPYRIEGTAEVKTGIGSLNFPFSKEGRIDLRK